eukprot:TCALIF_10666-PA protein Name:"Similar to Nfatc2ip NFATC2-interacting protein (Rattus norvegicus)" AED:0.11 eAED:0.11 QI:0/0.66/0.5/0.75/1/1/4/150/348
MSAIPMLLIICPIHTGHVRQEFHGQGGSPRSENDSAEEEGDHHTSPPAKRVKVCRPHPGILPPDEEIPSTRVASSSSYSNSSSDSEVTPPPTPENPVQTPILHSQLDHGHVTRSQARSELSQPNSRGRGRVRGGLRSRRTDMALSRLRLERMERLNRHRDLEVDEKTDREETEDGDADGQMVCQGSQSFEMKVRWRHAIIRDMVDRNDTFADILERLALKIDIPVRGLQLRLDPDILKPSETIASRHVGVASILSLEVAPSMLKDSFDDFNNQDLIELKCQASDRRSTVMIKLGPQDPMSRLMEKYSELKKCPLNTFRFTLDGQDLNDDDTPLSLDLEGGECIDVIPV